MSGDMVLFFDCQAWVLLHHTLLPCCENDFFHLLRLWRERFKNLIEKLKEQKWTFTLIGTDNLDVEGMAQMMSIDEHMEFGQDEESTDAMFVKERSARERFYGYVNSGIAMPTGSFFEEDALSDKN